MHFYRDTDFPLHSRHPHSMDVTRKGSINAMATSELPLLEVCSEVSSYVGTLYALDDKEPLDEPQREEAFDKLLSCRDNLEQVELGASESHEEFQIENTLNQVETALEELELLDFFDCPHLNDPCGVDEPVEASQPVASLVRETLVDNLSVLVTPREALRAIQLLVPDTEEDSGLDEDEFQEATSLALDYLIHDWRWEEGRGVLDRAIDMGLFNHPEEKATIQGLRQSWFELYQVEDFDSDRGSMHLVRMRDGIALDLETDEEMEDDFGEGDVIIARVYQWEDGLELGAWLPIEQEVLESLQESMEGITSGEEFIAHAFEEPNQGLKVHGIELLREIFYPEDDAD